jgi:hypothetical protein
MRHPDSWGKYQMKATKAARAASTEMKRRRCFIASLSRGWIRLSPQESFLSHFLVATHQAGLEFHAAVVFGGWVFTQGLDEKPIIPWSQRATFDNPVDQAVNPMDDGAESQVIPEDHERPDTMFNTVALAAQHLQVFRPGIVPVGAINPVVTLKMLPAAAALALANRSSPGQRHSDPEFTEQEFPIC